MAMKKHDTDLFLNADAAVPISRLADMMEETRHVINNAGLTGSTLGHVGDGKPIGFSSIEAVSRSFVDILLQGTTILS